MSTKHSTPEYQNNPFFVAVDGIKLLFAKALSIAILLIVLAVLASSSQSVQTVFDLQNGYYTNTSEEQQAKDEATAEAFMSTVTHLTPQEWTLVAIVVTVIMLLFIIGGTILSGINDYTAAQLAKNKETTLGQALKAVMSRFFSYLWLVVLVGVKILLWSLLFIVPGIIMAVRYSLAGTAFFHDNLRGSEAIKRSLTLTKNSWITTFGSFSLFNIITLGLIQPILQPGIQGVLYRQYAAYDAAKLEKPAAHGLSWLALFLPLLILSFLIACILIFVFTFSIFAPGPLVPWN